MEEEDILQLPDTIDDTPILPLEQSPSIKSEDLPEEWGIGKVRYEMLQRSIENKQRRHGLLSSIPLICRKDECPFKDFCQPYKRGEVVKGERCIKEIAEIVESAQAYYTEFRIDPHNPDYRVDVTQVSELISTEVLMRRCEMLLAKGDLVELVETAIDPRTGEAVVQPQLNKAAEALPKYQRRHSEILKDLSATRREKLASSAQMGLSIADYNKEMLSAAALYKARRELMRQGKYKEADALTDGQVIDGDFEEQK